MRNSLSACLSALLVGLLALSACSSDPKKSSDPGDTGGTGGTAGSAGSGGSAGDSGYPAGPYGKTAGTTVENLSFTGVLHPDATAYKVAGADIKTINLSDFYNPTGDTTKPRVLLVTASARWCPSCKEEAKTAQADWEQWNPKGVEFLTLIFEDENFDAATTDDMMIWADAFNLTYPMGIDPKLTELNGYFKADSAPFNMVVDLRTMKITYADVGSFFPSGGADELNKALGN